jgi:hypothetical protein
MQTLLQKSHFIHKLLFISTLTIVRVHKRFYPGGKEVGHASKILNAAKPPIVPSIPSTATQQPTSFPKSMTSITSQGPSNPSFPKSSITIQNYAAQKSIQEANNHLAYSQKAPITQEQPKKLLSKMSPALKTITSISGKKFETKITPTMTITDLTKPQLLEELKGRELVKDDDGKTETDVLLADDTVYHLGQRINNVKLTPMGQAYANQIHAQIQTQAHIASETPNFPPNKKEESQFMITIPPKSAENLLIETGKQTHLIIMSMGHKIYKGFAYLTSKNSGKYLSDQQFGKFQKQQEGQQVLNDKIQNIAGFHQPIILEENDIQPVKWGSEYLAKLSEKGKKAIVNALEEAQKNPPIPFNKNGVTSEDALQMCKAHDTTIAQGKPHPMTPDQIEQHKKGLEKQKAAQLAKKPEKIMKDKENNNNIQNV